MENNHKRMPLKLSFQIISFYITFFHINVEILNKIIIHLHDMVSITVTVLELYFAQMPPWFELIKCFQKIHALHIVDHSSPCNKSSFFFRCKYVNYWANQSTETSTKGHALYLNFRCQKSLKVNPSLIINFLNLLYKLWYIIHHGARHDITLCGTCDHRPLSNDCFRC